MLSCPDTDSLVSESVLFSCMACNAEDVAIEWDQLHEYEGTRGSLTLLVCKAGITGRQNGIIYT